MRRRIVAAAVAAGTCLAAGALFCVRRVRTQTATAAEAAKVLAMEQTDVFRESFLIEELRRPPQMIVLGGSRTLRLDPTFIRARTGLRGFNAAVTGARPDDAWALVNLIHARFPTARFRALWVIHADELDWTPLDLALVWDPALSRYFQPAALAALRVAALDRRIPVDPCQVGRVFAADGVVRRDLFDLLAPVPGDDAVAVRHMIEQALPAYRTSQASLLPACLRYFAATLRLIEENSAARPAIAMAPVDPSICAATRRAGWGTRHRLVLAFLARLRRRYPFDFADFSRASSCGCAPGDFFAGMHLHPSGTRQVFDAVLRRFPGDFLPKARRAK